LRAGGPEGSVTLEAVRYAGEGRARDGSGMRAGIHHLHVDEAGFAGRDDEAEVRGAMGLTGTGNSTKPPLFCRSVPMGRGG